MECGRESHGKQVFLRNIHEEEALDPMFETVF